MKNEWDVFLKSTHNFTFLFFRQFMEYHKDRFNDASMLIYKNNRLFALLPGNIEDNTFYSHQGLTYGGLLYQPDEKLEDVAMATKAILKMLAENGIGSIIIKDLPSIYKSVQDDTMSYLSFWLKGECYRKDVLSVIAEGKMTLSNSRKEGLKRAVKNKLRFEETDDLSIFWEKLLIPNLKTKYNKTPVHSLEEITYLKSLFHNQIRQFNVYYDKKLVAGATLFETKYVAHVQYISGNSDKNELGAIDFLHVKLISEVFKDKHFFDFGMSHTESGQINKGLHFWKEGFGAVAITQDFIKIKTDNYPLLDTLFA